MLAAFTIVVNNGQTLYIVKLPQISTCFQCFLLLHDTTLCHQQASRPAKPTLTGRKQRHVLAFNLVSFWSLHAVYAVFHNTVMRCFTTLSNMRVQAANAVANATGFLFTTLNPTSKTRNGKVISPDIESPETSWLLAASP